MSNDSTKAIAQSWHKEAKDRWRNLGELHPQFEEYLIDLQNKGIDISSLVGADLYLCWLCLKGDVDGLHILCEELIPAACYNVARVDSSPTFIEEIGQVLRIKLLVGENPKLRQYQGLGPLVGWLSVAAMREAISDKRKRQVFPPADLADLPVPTKDLSLDVIRQQYYPEFLSTLQRATQKLTPHERTILRMHYIDNVSFEALGNLYQLHRTTMGRRVANLRQQLFEQCREEMQSRLQISNSDFDSVIQQLFSNLPLNLSSIL